jgi:hypothetical protein
MSRQQFLASSGLKVADIFRHFPKWSDALAATGFSFDPYHEKIAPEALLTDWGLLVRRLRRIPTRNQYKLEDDIAPGFSSAILGLGRLSRRDSANLLSINRNGWTL